MKNKEDKLTSREFWENGYSSKFISEDINYPIIKITFISYF